MNADIKNTVKQCATCMEYQHTQPHEKTMPYKMAYNPSRVVSADIFSITNNILLCIVNYYSMFPIVKKTGGLLANDLIKAAKIVFTGFVLPKEIVSHVGTTFRSDKFKQVLQAINRRTSHNSILSSPE